MAVSPQSLTASADELPEGSCHGENDRIRNVEPAVLLFTPSTSLA